MNKTPDIFELEEIQSPEDVGRLLKITEPGMILALVTGIFLTVAALAWSVLGSVPETVRGSGILVPPGGLMDVVALGSGQITEILHQEGQPVQKEQIIARLMIPELENLRKAARTELEDARTWLEKRSNHFERTLKIQKANTSEQTRYLAFRKKYLTEYFAFLKSRVQSLDKLRKSGSVTGKQLEETRSRMNEIMAEISQCDLDISRIGAELIEAQSEAELEILKTEERMAKAELEMANLARSIDIETRVVSAHDGVVADLLAEPGDFVEKGQAVAVLKPADAPLEAVILLPVDTGKKVTVGMTARIFPTTAEKETYGCMKGRVDHISEYPVTKEGFRRVVGDSQMIEFAMSKGEQKLLAKIVPEADPGLPSGFKWSSSIGPDHAILAGTLSDAQIIIGSRRPIDLIIPGISEKIRAWE